MLKKVFSIEDLEKEFDIVIGIETHSKINTKHKLFSECMNHETDEPNKNINCFSAGHPGWYPVLNISCLKKACIFGLSINGDISELTAFERKTYFYHDLPKNFQITQLTKPIIRNGFVRILSNGIEKNIAIERVQIEEDAGSTKNFDKISGINLNRAGSPLLEIVTKPEIHSIDDAVAYCKQIKQILEINDVGNTCLEQGELRFDCNVSLKPKTSTVLGIRYEIKNLNSFYNIEKSLEEAIKEQFIILKNNNSVEQRTLKWDADKKKLSTMREKESSFYGFSYEVDIPEYKISRTFVESLKFSVREDPVLRTIRFMKKFNIDEDEAKTSVYDYKLADFMEKLFDVHGICAKDIFSWICVESRGIIKSLGKSTEIYCFIDEASISKIINLVNNNVISRKSAKTIIELFINGHITDIDSYINTNPQIVCIDESFEQIQKTIDFVLQENPDVFEKIQNGNTKVLDFLVGQTTKILKGKANPKTIKEQVYNTYGS